MSKISKQGFKRIDDVFGSVIFRRPELQAEAILERFAGLEVALIEILREEGCWDDKASDLIPDRYFGRTADAHGSHLLKAALSRKAIHAVYGLCAVRKLRPLLIGGNDSWVSITACVMMVESAIPQIMLDPFIAKESGSRRLQNPKEAEKKRRSIAVYRQAQLAAKDSRKTIYGAYTDAVDALPEEEVYKPKSENAFNQRVAKWRKGVDFFWP